MKSRPVALTFEQFIAPKIGMGAETIEDAICSRLTDEQFVVAVADGATQAFAAARWAGLLSAHFVARPQISRISQAWLDPIKEKYRAQIDFASLPWHALDKAGRGSFATLLGLIVDFDRRRYRAIAVGDSCLVILDDSGPAPCVDVFPRHLSDVAAFTNSPYLIATNPAYNARLPKMQYRMRAWRPLPERATFLLMTDALAAWFVGAYKRGEKPWDRLTGLHSHEEFEHIVAALRESEGLRDDDITLFLINLSSDCL